MINIIVHFIIVLNKSINMIFESFFTIIKKIIFLFEIMILAFFCIITIIFYLYKYLTI